MSLLEKLQKKKGKKWILLYAIFSLNTILIIGIFVLLRSYWGDINLFVSDFAGFDLNLVLIFFTIVLTSLSYAIVLFISNIRKYKRFDEINPHFVNKIIPVILLMLFNAIVIVLVVLLQEYSKIIFQIIEFYSIYIYITVSIALILLIYPLFKVLPELKAHLSERFLKPKSKVGILCVSFAFIYGFVFVSPLISDIANVMDYNIPPKPDIIAHRGGTQIGPENTIETVRYAMNFDIVGWEVDIGISFDGIPFLMHDNTLTRTTNIAEVFPNRKGDRADSFTMTELKQLDAGSWYVENDPYGVIASGVVTQEQAEKYRGVKIPTFEEVLNFTRDNNLILDFDPRSPPEGHPYRSNFTEILFNMTLDLIPDLTKIMIPTSSDTWLNLIDNRNANEIWTYRNYDNTGDSHTNAEYREFYRKDFPIMVYTINTIERFSQLWSLGVRWVKTDTPHLFVGQETPIWALRIEHYVILWVVIYIIAISSVVLIRFKILNNPKESRK